MDSCFKMSTTTQKGDTKNSNNGFRTPEKKWCPKRRRITRTSRIRTPDDGTDPSTLQFEELEVSGKDEKLELDSTIPHSTTNMDEYNEFMLRIFSLIDQMTPQKVKYQRSKKRRR